jgi:GH43 family beta-xylosidase
MGARFRALFCITVAAWLSWVSSQAQTSAPPPAKTTFTNPLLNSGPDPWITSRDRWYYYMNTTTVNLIVRKTRDITDLRNAQSKVVWNPPASGPYSKDIWAPEIHFVNGRWYIYFAADDHGDNHTHRIYAIENASGDPLSGEWTFKGKVSDPADKWAIDATVFDNNGQWYMVWSGWPDDRDGTQNLYIAHMKNAWMIDGKRVRISTPNHNWEQIGDIQRLPGSPDPTHVNINEGPEILQHGDRIFLTYSANACWTESYELGLLEAAASANLLDPKSWKKSPNPVFTSSEAAHAYSPGHNGFFTSPDGKQNWIIYHANPEAHQGCGNLRSPGAQPFTWNSDGTPNFGQPVALGQPIPKPSSL